MGYSPTYLKTINNQLSAIFNYAVRYYDLKSNPCAKAGSMGKSKAEEMDFWTGEEFRKFIDSVMNKRLSYMAFMTLYWTGMRLGELLALNPKDVDLEKRTITITKSYQRLCKKDVITPPKTPKSKRVITIPEFLAADIRDYIDSLYELQENDRLFPITKYYLEHEMQRGIKESGVKRIRVHDLRHSHASMLIELGFSPLEIANRLGYEKVETTLNTYAHLYPNNNINKELKNSGQIKLVLPEAGALELASTYRNKKIKPLFAKIKNYVAGLVAKVIELSRETEKWRDKYQQLKKDYNDLEKDADKVADLCNQLCDDVDKLEVISDKYNRALRIFGSDTIASAIWHDIQREKALEEQKRKEQVPRKLNDRLQWGREKSQEYNMQQKKNKNKHRERDL